MRVSRADRATYLRLVVAARKRRIQRIPDVYDVQTNAAPGALPPLLPAKIRDSPSLHAQTRYGHFQFLGNLQFRQMWLEGWCDLRRGVG